MQLRPIAISVLLMALVAASLAGARLWRSAAGKGMPTTKVAALAATPQPPLPPDSKQLQTPHFIIHSSAPDEQAQKVATAVEALYAAYVAFFADPPAVAAGTGKMQLVLYQDQAEFKRHNRSKPWAEAYYLPPRSHAYYGDGDNAVHWTTHEVTHQLNHELAHFKRRKWIDEGLADYFGSSWITDGKLIRGSIDPATYPVWWLPSMALSGNLQEDIGNGKIIPLRAIVSGRGGPSFDRNVNLYYLEYWSLTHFLLHYQDGKYAKAYRQLIAGDGTLDEFERLIGPIEQIQLQWYPYLQRLAATQQPMRVKL